MPAHDPPGPRKSASLAALLIAAALAALACSPPPEAAPAPRPPVVLISLDTLRADAVGAAVGGGRTSLTPQLDRFAEDAVIFRRAVAPMAFTLPSHMSMFTGLHPRVHRVTTPTDRLAESIPTLPQLLRRAGYHTVGWMTNEWLKSEFGFGRGFDRYRQVRHRLTYSPRVNARARQTIAEAADDPRPLFLFLHYMDPHSDFSGPGPFENNRLPYYSPEPFRADLGAPGAEDGVCDGAGNCATDFLVAADAGNRPVPPERLDRIRRLYEAGVRYVDRDVGRLLGSLRESGFYDRALIVVTSDHGEEFREHGLFLHSQTYDESVLVPLMIKLPVSRFAGRTVDGQVELSDLMPTILDVAGVAAPAAIQGRSLLPMIEDGAGGRLEVLVQDKLRRQRFALRTPGAKLIHDLETGRSELYDLAADPGERRDLGAERPERTERMRRRLEALLRDNRRFARRIASDAEVGGSVLDEEERKRLRSLGYLD